MKSEKLFATLAAACALFGASCSGKSGPNQASGGAPAQAGQTGQAGGSSGGAGNAGQTSNTIWMSAPSKRWMSAADSGVR